MSTSQTFTARITLLAAAAVTALSLFAGGCATVTPDSGVAAWDCITDTDCAAGEYCSAEDTCETACTPGESQCGDGFSCNDDWYCEEDTASIDDGETETDSSQAAVDAD